MQIPRVYAFYIIKFVLKYTFLIQTFIIWQSMFLDQLTQLEEFLNNHRMSRTLLSLRQELASKISSFPSQQILSLIANQTHQQLTVAYSPLQANTNKNELLAQGLLGKIAYSSKILDDQLVNDRIAILLQNRIFQKAVAKMFPSAAQRLNRNHFYTDQLNNTISLQAPQERLDIVMNETDPSQIQPVGDLTLLSHPSYVLQQLQNNQPSNQDEYVDDNDLGYYEFQYIETQLMSGCSKLTQKYGYPSSAVKKTVRVPPNSKNKKNRKFQSQVSFPSNDDNIYPLQYNGTIYDSMKIKVVYDREKTGYQQAKQIEIGVGTILLGKYEVIAILGSGVFAKVVKVRNLLQQGEVSCFKVVSNNKDFFDQSLDQIKLLRLIKANFDTNTHFLLNFKEAVYYKEHLLLQTQLLSDNLFVAYRKNPSFFSISTIKQIAFQILTALASLHSLNILHSDLKPQNILIQSYSPVAVKVVDLGNSCFLHDQLAAYVQSRSYRAPQVILGNPYDCKIDVWSVGCILAQLWTKNVLFYNICLPGMLARMQSILGPWPEWMLQTGTKVSQYFSKENLIFYEQDSLYHILIPKKTTLKNRIRTEDESFLEFIAYLLELDPNRRPSAQQALNHAFLH